jgi:hypothetical protein
MNPINHNHNNLNHQYQRTNPIIINTLSMSMHSFKMLKTKTIAYNKHNKSLNNSKGVIIPLNLEKPYLWCQSESLEEGDQDSNTTNKARIKEPPHLYLRLTP